MKIKIIAIATALFMIIPSMSAFAEVKSTPEPHNYKQGLLDDKDIIKLNELPKETYDNGTWTKAELDVDKPYVIEFNHPVHLKGYYLSVSTDATIYTFYFADGSAEYIASEKTTKGGYTILDYENVVSIEIRRTKPGYSYEIYEIDFFGSYDTDVDSPPEPNIKTISNLEYEVTTNSILFNYDLPNQSTFSHLKIIVNGSQEYTTNVNHFILEGLEENSEYEITFISVDRYGEESPGVTVKLKTLDKIIGEVKEVNVVSTHNRVDLSWQLPQIEDFHHVVIYRKTIEELKDIETASLLDKIFGANKVYASEETEYDPLFETNGTYFNDLTVKPRSEYAYKLTTVTTEGEESPGVIVTAETPDEPNPQIVGGGYTETEEGDYLFKWTSPTEGQVKIIVGGKEYKTVNASDKQILIPKEDMVYAFHKPDVSLIPISPYGKEGNEFSSHPIKQIKIPFGANDLLKTGVSLLWVLGPFVLLAMAFLLVPKFRKTIVDAFNKKSENKRVSV